MNCKKVLARLEAYADGETSEGFSRQMKEHICGCPACQVQLERIRQVGAILDSLTVPPIPEELSNRVMAEARRRVSAAEEKRSFFPRVWQELRWLLELSAPMRLAVCAVVLVACLLGMVMSKEVAMSWNRQSTVSEAENLDGFEWFGPSPPASLGSAYFSLASSTPEDQGAR